MEINRPELIAGRKAGLIKGGVPQDAPGVRLESALEHPAPLFCRFCQRVITQRELDDGEVERLSGDPEDVAHRWCVALDEDWKERGGR